MSTMTKAVHPCLSTNDPCDWEMLYLHVHKDRERLRKAWEMLYLHVHKDRERLRKAVEKAATQIEIEAETGETESAEAKTLFRIAKDMRALVLRSVRSDQ